ncbi:condensin complex non-SMC subunit Cnd1 [Cryomyces antarcticus]|nr:condensin complex non-SMC subunit Cnd1 [Cryomyces antarcticus]
MAEFLHILAEQYDYAQLTEEVLRELSNKEFNSNDAKGPKSVSMFITKISELAPRLVIKQMTLLAKLLDSESYTLRCAIIEVCGNLIAMLSKQEGEERSETHKGQINAFFDVLEERLLDINPYCRCRAIQVYVKLCDLETKFPKRRQTAAELAARSLEDKSSNVRRNAIKLLEKLVSTHPFGILHGGQLSFKEWDARLHAVDAELNALKPPPGTPGLVEKPEATVDESLLDEATQLAGSPQKQPVPMTNEQKQAAMEAAMAEAATSEAMTKLQLTRRYYVEALRFIEVLHTASPTVSQLLSSKNKSEVIEAMDFFVIIDAYKVETAREWFGVAEQAVGAIYALSKHPDVLCSTIIRKKTKEVFQQQQEEQKPEPREITPQDEDVEMSGMDELPAEDTPAQESVERRKDRNAAIALSQLLFIVGHVAIKQIVHLELCEQDFKRRKAEKEKTKSAVEPSPAKKGSKTPGKRQQATEEEQDELDLIAGTTEDDFTEAIAHIRERELLYGPTSLLSSFGPLVAEICANNTAYANKQLQAQAALCLAKLMCVSAEYCEQNLSLLITILERSTDATTRSNLVVALGDMAVCFNHLIDESTDFLYRRLCDEDQSVKRTCLMTLTFLILAGQVKVKGQLGEMAKCLEDSDKRISDMARMFFSELATKDNAVYNHFVDMFSLLSADEALEEEAFRKIVKFLATFIEKVRPSLPFSEIEFPLVIATDH